MHKHVTFDVRIPTTIILKDEEDPKAEAQKYVDDSDRVVWEDAINYGDYDLVVTEVKVCEDETCESWMWTHFGV